MSYKFNLKDEGNLNINSDTIEVNKEEVVGRLEKRKSFTNNEAFPWMSITISLIYILIYIFCVYGKENMIDLDLTSLNLFKVSNGFDILNGNFGGVITNIFVHRSLWDLINTIFVIVFCGFFVERYIKRSVIIISYILSLIGFNLVSIFLYPNVIYLGSFTIVSFLIGMSIYFSYRFRRFVLKIDGYIYIALTFIGLFISYMVQFYNIFHFILSYIIGGFIVFVLDTKVLRNNKDNIN